MEQAETLNRHQPELCSEPTAGLPALWRKTSDEAELARLRKALREYCRMDTLGVVKLLEKLRDMAR
jgi:hypothetical protein